MRLNSSIFPSVFPYDPLFDGPPLSTPSPAVPKAKEAPVATVPPQQEEKLYLDKRTAKLGAVKLTYKGNSFRNFIGRLHASTLERVAKHQGKLDRAKFLENQLTQLEQLNDRLAHMEELLCEASQLLTQKKEQFGRQRLSVIQAKDYSKLECTLDEINQIVSPEDVSNENVEAFEKQVKSVVGIAESILGKKIDIKSDSAPVEPEKLSLPQEGINKLHSLMEIYSKDAILCKILQTVVANLEALKTTASDVWDREYRNAEAYVKAIREVTLAEEALEKKLQTLEDAELAKVNLTQLESMRNGLSSLESLHEYEAAIKTLLAP